MRVLMINSVCGIRSTGRICTDLADVLRANGHECKIAYGREIVPEQYQDISYRIGSNMDVKFHALKTRVFDCAGFCSEKATKRLIQEIKDYAPDIIHLHNLHGYYLNIEILFRFLSLVNIPVVWTLHDCWAFTGHCAYFTSVKCERWKGGCFRCPQKKQYPSSILLDHSTQNWDKKSFLFNGVQNMTLVTPSIWLANLAEESFLKKYKIKVIPNGIDLNVFKPTDSNFREKNALEGKKIILGVATTWSERKGLNEFVELAELLDDSYQIVLFGLSKKQISELPRNILGFPVTNTAKELAGVYTQADVFVNAGKEETMGLTTIEAMACGTPVVVSNLTAVPEVVMKEGGIVLDNLSAVDIKNGIERVLDMRFEPRYNALRYEKKQQYLKYLELYKNILECQK